MEDLLTIIKQNILLNEILIVLKDFPSEDLFLGAGSIAQAVWNFKFDKDPSFGINDIDIIFYNDSNLSEDYEMLIYNQIIKLFQTFSIRIDLKNQARVHLWYSKKFNSQIKPITSIEDAIKRWPTTATSIAIRIKTETIIAPFGTSDLLSCIVRPNKTQITRDIYMSKVNKWLKLWPDLKIIPW